MSAAVNKGVFLALDAGVRESGWAVFGVESGPVTGVVKTGPRRRLDAHGRVSLLLEHLDRVVERWHPKTLSLVCLRGSVGRCRRWNYWNVLSPNGRRSAAYPFTVTLPREVRAAIAGHPNATGDQLGYAVMLRLGLIGQSKTTHEWDALAVGHYHLLQSHSGS